MSQAQFDALIDADERIEPDDWMPDDYRKTLVRQIAQHAHSEIIGMQPEGEWITRAPSLHRKAILTAKVQDEAGHGMYLYGAAETSASTGLNSSTASTTRRRSTRPSSTMRRPSGPTSVRSDGSSTARDRQSGSALPLLLRTLRAGDGSDLQRGELHQRQGFQIMLTLSEGTPEQKAMAQRALNRWWWPSIMMFGPPDADSPNTARSMAWGIKRYTNDELRQQFVDATVPQAELLGLTVPDADLMWNEERGHYDFGDPDWEEFARMVKGEGEIPDLRISTRRNAHAEGEWVREAAVAYAEKQQQRERVA